MSHQKAARIFFSKRQKWFEDNKKIRSHFSDKVSSLQSIWRPMDHRLWYSQRPSASLRVNWKVSDFKRSQKPKLSDHILKMILLKLAPKIIYKLNSNIQYVTLLFFRFMVKARRKETFETLYYFLSQFWTGMTSFQVFRKIFDYLQLVFWPKNHFLDLSVDHWHEHSKTRQRKW